MCCIHECISYTTNTYMYKLTDIKTKLTTTTTGGVTLTCSVYGVDQNQVNDTVIQFNRDSHKFKCDKNNLQPGTKLFDNGTTCQLTVREEGNYSCIVTLGITKPCLLQSQIMSWHNDHNETLLAIIIALAGVTSLSIILCITLIVTCIYRCKPRGRQRSFVNIEVHDEGILLCLIPVTCTEQ